MNRIYGKLCISGRRIFGAGCEGGATKFSSVGITFAGDSFDRRWWWLCRNCFEKESEMFNIMFYAYFSVFHLYLALIWRTDTSLNVFLKSSFYITFIISVVLLVHAILVNA